MRNHQRLTCDPKLCMRCACAVVRIDLDSGFKIVQSYESYASKIIQHTLHESVRYAETKDAMAQIGFALGEFVGLTRWNQPNPQWLSLMVWPVFLSTNSWDVSWQKEPKGESFFGKGY